MQLGALRRHLIALVGLLMAAQAVGLALMYSRIRHSAGLHSELRQLDELRAELHGLRAAALDAETGQRGFVITGREEFLQPYRAALLTLPARRERLHVLLARRPELAPRAAAMLAQLQVAQTALAQLVELRRHEGFAAAQQQMLEGGQREAMDLLRALTVELDDEALRQAQGRQHDSSLAAAALGQLAFFGCCGSLLLTAGLGGFLLVRLRMVTSGLGRPLVEVGRNLRAAAKAARRDARGLAEFAQSDSDARAEGQAALAVITRMAKELSTVAMELTSSVRAVSEGPPAGEPAAAEPARIVTLAGRLAQTALSLELTAAEQCRVLDGASAARSQLEQSVRCGEQAAGRLRQLTLELVLVLQQFPGLLGPGRPAAAPLDGSDYEIAPLRTLNLNL